MANEDLQDITEEFQEQLAEWTKWEVKLLNKLNEMTGRRWHTLRLLYDSEGTVTGCQLYGESPDSDAVLH